MHGGGEHLLGVVAVVAASDQRLAALGSALRDSEFRRIESAQSLGGLRERIRQGCRDDQSDVLLAVVDGDAITADAGGEGRALFALAHEAGTAVLVVTEGPAADVERAVAEFSPDAGPVAVIGDEVRADAMGPQFTLHAAMQLERRRRYSRERELESELAGLRVMESRLQHMVYHDELTGLSNRRRLKEAVELSILRTANLSRPCALVLVDIDRFKLVNDLEGYDAGDRMLIEIARILSQHACAADTVARIGSDEFVMLLDNVTPEAAMRRAEELQRQLESYRFRRGHRSYRTCVSVGVAPLDAGDDRPCTSELLARADQACFVAKRQGRNRVECYSDTHPELALFRRDYGLAPLIRDAVEHDRFFFCFQPIARVLDGHLTHYECLLRMRGPDDRVYMPGDFIPVAERTGLIHHIDMWVVDHALDFLSRLPPERSDVSVSINLSGHAFHNRDLFDLISKRLELSWVSPTRLVMEITETAAIENMEACRDVVARLRALGCRFALDDFGSGFSTFHYIKHFPVDYLKLDGSFIENLTRDSMDQALVRHMIAIARSLGKETIAEFVESRDTLDMLATFGVDYIQGHYIGRATEEPVSRINLPAPRATQRDAPGMPGPLMDALLMGDGPR